MEGREDVWVEQEAVVSQGAGLCDVAPAAS